MASTSTGHRVENVAIRAIVDDVLAEDEGHKAKRKREKDTDAKPKKSVRFKDVDDVHEFVVDEDDKEEGGPVKEHLLGQAWQKRQQTRDGKSIIAGDIEFNDGSELEPEVDAEYDRLDGEEVSAFNMKDEEAEGFNAATGEILPRKTDDEELAQDPWLLSLQQEEREEMEGDDGVMRAKVRRSQVMVDTQTKQRLQQQQAALDNMKPLSDEELAQARSTLVEHMQARETVMQAMARLSAKPTKGTPKKPVDRVGKKRITPEEQARLDLIERFTDAASSLLSTEADIFEQHKEELQHALRMSNMLRAPAAQPSAATATRAEDSDDDMFADSDTEAAPALPASGAAAATMPSGAAVPQSAQPGEGMNPTAEDAAAADNTAGTPAAAANPVDASGTSPEQDYSSWPVSELKRVLREANVDTSGATEKSDLVSKMHDLDKQRAAKVTPAGFVLDPGSGYYYNVETGWYYHAESQCYYRGGKWYHMNTATGALQEMAA
eukprot:jgi/Ulvmu1/12306/UM088_0026.1